MNSDPATDRVDDLSIDAEEVLWRRVLPDWLHREPDGRVRAGSHAFIDRQSGELSVNIAALTSIESVRQTRPGDFILAFKAGVPRKLGLKIVRDPEPDDPSHALICPSPDKKQAKVINKQTWWVGAIPE
jgi:hypothetical protein